MSFIDKILDKMSLNSEDDEEFDNEDYYLDDEEEEELPRNPFRRKKEAAEEEPAIKSTRRDTTPKEKPVKTTSKITPISKSSRKQVSSDMEVCVIKPSSIEDEIEIPRIEAREEIKRMQPDFRFFIFAATACENKNGALA